jgi:hypothetical protein
MIVIGVVLGLTAFDLNNIASKSPLPSFTNAFTVQMQLNSTSPAALWSYNVTQALMPTLSGLNTSQSESAQVLNVSTTALPGVGSQLVLVLSSTLVVTSSVNYTTADITNGFANATVRNNAAAANTSSVVASRLLSVSAKSSSYVPPSATYSPFGAWLVLFVVIGILSLLMKENILPPDAVLVLALVILVSCEVITVKEALAGFSNEGDSGW